MKNYLITVALITIAVSQTVILKSGLTSSTITNPPGSAVILDSYHTSVNPDFLGTGAAWIWTNITGSNANGYSLTFQTMFFADCPGNGILTITADNSFEAWLNGVSIGTGNDWTVKYDFKVELRCGLNNLTVKASNMHEGSPAALIFSLKQDQSNCYQCKGEGVYYNRDSCKCECSTKCLCEGKALWQGYPTCGCICRQAIDCKENRYFSQKTCLCECKRKYCEPGFLFQASTCECIPCRPIKCRFGMFWDKIRCRCIGKIAAASSEVAESEPEAAHAFTFVSPIHE